MASVRGFGLSLALLFAAAFSGAQQAAPQPTAAELQSVLSDRRSSDELRQKADTTTKSPEYNLSPSPRRYDTNFAERAFERLSFRSESKPRNAEESRPRREPIDTETTLSFVQMLMWGILVVGVAVALYFIFRNAEWGKRGAGADGGDALMTEAEARFSPQHWLQLADRLEAEGKYREAVRALYLAGMVTLDRRKILQLRPWETNWEHLRRFEAGTIRPAVGMAGVTRDFDDLWYGNRVSSTAEVAEFRAFARQASEVPIA